MNESQPTTEEWMAMVAAAFDFLEVDGFRLVAVEQTPKLKFWRVRCRYMAPHVAVDFCWNREYGRADAFVIELDAGEVPAYPAFVTADAPVRWFNVVQLTRMRDSELADQMMAISGLDPASLAEQLRLYAQGVRLITKDALGAERPLLREREAAMQEKARLNPPTMIAYISGEAPKEREREIIERGSGFVGVGIEVKRLRKRSVAGTNVPLPGHSEEPVQEQQGGPDPD